MTKPAASLPPIPCTKYPAWDHQLEAYHYAIDPAKPGVMLYAHMGTGKTKISIDVIINQGYKRVLIVCPKAVLSVWPQEFKKHAGHNRWQVWNSTRGTVERRTKEAAEFMNKCAITGDIAIVCINYESVWREPFGKWAMSKAGFDLVICDESHKIKGAGGQCSRYMSRLGNRVQKRMCLTGTPMPHSPLDIYGQYRFLDKRIFGTNFSMFKTHYAILIPIPGTSQTRVVAFQNLEELHHKLFSIAFHVTSDVLTLPERVNTTISVELTDTTRKIYRSMEKDFYALVEDYRKNRTVEASATNVLSRLLRLQQIVSGFVKPDESDRYLRVGTEKAEALAELMDGIDMSEPIVVFCQFHKDLDAIKETCAKAGRSCAELSGRMNQLAEWQNGDYNSIAVQVKAGGAGVDLTRAHYCIYYSAGYSLGDFEQSEARPYRPGQTKTTFFYYLVASGTVDEKIYAALRSKRKVIDLIQSGEFENSVFEVS